MSAITPGKYVSRGRLVWLTGARSPESWGHLWQGRMGDMIAAAKAGHYPHRSLFKKYLAPGARVLDGGCGSGAIVAGLNSDGYNTEGIEQSPEIVSQIRAAYPEYRGAFVVGDVSDLAYIGDGEFDGYVSLGVVEHFTDPGVPLSEAARVLRTGAVAFISVPYLNWFRRWKMRRQRYPSAPDTYFAADFYQQAFSRSDFTVELAAVGLRVVDVRPFSTLTGLSRELGGTGSRLLKWPPIRKAVNALEYAPGVPGLVGHMAMYVAVKQPQPCPSCGSTESTFDRTWICASCGNTWGGWLTKYSPEESFGHVDGGVRLAGLIGMSVIVGIAFWAGFGVGAAIF